MGDLSFEFDRNKSIETILYLSERVSDPTLHSITHLLYFADKTSLERFGRFICGDDYFAMQYGPIPTHTLDILKEAEWSQELPFSVKDAAVTASRKASIEEFSDSDIECLDLVLDLYGDAPFWKRRDDSHDDAWRAAWENKGSKRSERMPVESIVSMLQNSEELLDFLTEHNPA